MKIAEINGLRIVQDCEYIGFCLKSICQVLGLDFGMVKLPFYRERYGFADEVLTYPSDDLILISRGDFIKMLVYEAVKKDNKKAIVWLCALAEEGVNQAIK